MANGNQSLKKEETIDFTLKVKSSRKKNGPIEFSMDLNPDSRLLSIKETFSTLGELSEIFKTITNVLTDIQERTRLYNDVLQTDEKKKKKLFYDGYDQNFEPDFGKIDKIIHKRNSPGESTVSYARSYNGDKKPL